MEGSPALEVVESPLDAEDAIRANEPLPDALPVLPLRETVTFPETLTPLAVGQERSIKLVNDVLGANRMLAMVAARDPEDEEPGPDDLYDVGVAGTVARMMRMPDGTLRILVHGGERIKLVDYVSEEPYLVARIEEMPDVIEASTELEALTRNVQTTFSEIIEAIPYLPEELQLAVGQERSIKLVNDVLSGNRMLAMVASKDPELDAPGPEDLYGVGVVGSVARMMKYPPTSSFDSVNGPSVTVLPFFPESTLPVSSSGSPAMKCPSLRNFSIQLM